MNVEDRAKPRSGEGVQAALPTAARTPWARGATRPSDVAHKRA
jgi:hypothetical protein